MVLADLGDHVFRQVSVTIPPGDNVRRRGEGSSGVVVVAEQAEDACRRAEMKACRAVRKRTGRRESVRPEQEIGRPCHASQPSRAPVLTATSLLVPATAPATMPRVRSCPASAPRSSVGAACPDSPSFPACRGIIRKNEPATPPPTGLSILPGTRVFQGKLTEA
ncbi:hypothetical protein L226DRAFT_124108 [Lentinus tigrinus ALCF2SS1-7]|uniref:uncharacterized protein n=1 Tax=Lentinus tigrinus ALCF2SS1-7 TaxID=1328758 RepID=UPI0011663367|nr:hypothetical protein L226DRAFT_124108 [Lentinus tigrinus ALCF2SS1-7]